MFLITLISVLTLNESVVLNESAQKRPTLAVNWMRRGLIRDKEMEFNKGEQCRGAACDPRRPTWRPQR